MILEISSCRGSKAGSTKRSRARRMNSALVSATLGMPLRTFIFAMTDPPRPVEDSALFLSSAAGNRLQRLEVGGGGRQGLALDGAVVADQLDAARRQHRAAAGLAAGLRRGPRPPGGATPAPPPVLPPVCAETSGSVKLWLISATSSQARL